MKALADLGDHVFVKLSSPCYVDADWDKPGSRVPGLILELVAMFGAHRYCGRGHLLTRRCMLASNYPVDKWMGATPERLFAGLDAILGGLSAAEKKSIYCDSAAKFYRIALD